jgi:hypothetical protein
MLGHLMEWFYSGLGGIRQAEYSTGFKHIDIRPEPVGDVTGAEASYLSPYGVITSKWEERNGDFELNVTIPANTTATIYLPESQTAEITESGEPVNKSNDIKILDRQNGVTLISVGSGQYRFHVNTKK